MANSNRAFTARSSGWFATIPLSNGVVCSMKVPPYLRRQRVRLRYGLLDSTRVSVLDGGSEIPVRRVDPVGNAHRSRSAATTTAVAGDTPKTGLNVAELILARAVGIAPKGGSDE